MAKREVGLSLYKFAITQEGSQRVDKAQSGKIGNSSDQCVKPVRGQPSLHCAGVFHEGRKVYGNGNPNTVYENGGCVGESGAEKKPQISVFFAADLV